MSSFHSPSFTLSAPRPHEQGDQVHRNCKKSGNGACTNWTKIEGWSSVIATVPTALPLGCQDGCPPRDKLQPGQWCENCTSWWLITGVRYAWSESPCCGGTWLPPLLFTLLRMRASHNNTALTFSHSMNTLQAWPRSSCVWPVLMRSVLVCSSNLRCDVHTCSRVHLCVWL